MDYDSERPLLVIPDANVLIHGKTLVNIPWSELGRSQIEVLFVPPMIRELDKLKAQTGRPNKIARQLSGDIRKLISAPERRAEVRRAAPAVCKRLELRSAPESLHSALRLDHADQALINYALWLQQEGNDVLLLTDDTICGTTAQEVGLSVHFLPETWLRPPEPDESAKENRRLKAEIQRLSATEPKIELSFRSSEGKLLTEFTSKLTRWSALSDTELDDLMAEVEQLCPQATSFERPQLGATDALFTQFEQISRLSVLGLASMYEPATEKEIECYKTKDYPNWLDSIRSSLASLHLTLEARAKWPRLVAIIVNSGICPATDTLLTIQAGGEIQLLNDETEEEADKEEQISAKAESFKLPLPPMPPRGRIKTFDALEGLRNLNADYTGKTVLNMPNIPSVSQFKRRESDIFYWRVGRVDWVRTMELECASWRHGQKPLQFAFKVRPEDQTITSAVIEVSVHAHNIANLQKERLPIRFVYEDGATFDEACKLVRILGKTALRKGYL